MKSILVPIDFSSTSENALNYAAELAKRSKAKIVLLHVMHVPVITAEAPVVMPDMNDIAKDCIKQLRKLKRKVQTRYSTNLSVDCICQLGFAVDEIIDHASLMKADLIVMGMQGASFVSEKLIGSVTTSVIQRSKVPVLAIDQKVKFRSIRKVVLACDFESIGGGSVLKSLKQLVKMFKSHVYVLNVFREPEPVAATNELVSDLMRFDGSLVDLDHTFHEIQSDDVVDGINQFVEDSKIDLVVMVPRKHSFLNKLFKEPNTVKMAFHSKVPLLALH
jgi:nucleotide-binding universal stress UspA family protein